MAARRITATYHIETAHPLAEAVETMAGEQSTGTFVRLPGETDEMRELYGGAYRERHGTGRGREPSLPGAGVPKGRSGSRCGAGPRWSLSWPLENFGPSLPNLVATVAGNLFELRPFSGLRLLDLSLPEDSPTPIRGRSSASRGRGVSPGSRGGR